MFRFSSLTLYPSSLRFFLPPIKPSDGHWSSFSSSPTHTQLCINCISVIHLCLCLCLCLSLRFLSLTEPNRIKGEGEEGCLFLENLRKILNRLLVNPLYLLLSEFFLPFSKLRLYSDLWALLFCLLLLCCVSGWWWWFVRIGFGKLVM